MSEQIGKLHVEDSKVFLCRFKEGKFQEGRPIKRKQLNEDLQKIFDEGRNKLHGEWVEFDWTGQATNIRPTETPESMREKSPARKDTQKDVRQKDKLSTEIFHNPYNFIQAPNRDKSHNELGDANPQGHHRYHEDHYTGWIDVKLKTVDTVADSRCFDRKTSSR